MRPKKHILLVCANEERTSILRFILQTNAFVVTAVGSASEAWNLAQAQRFDLVFCVWPVEGIEHLLHQIDDMNDDVRTLVLADRLAIAPAGLFASAVLTKGCDVATIIDRVRLLGARKRGPRPYMPPAAVGRTERGVA